jgi:uncharacterized Zn finger protein (UPF0148 family)
MKSRSKLPLERTGDYKKVCPICDAVFYTSKHNKVYCSPTCADSAKLIKKAEYNSVRNSEERTARKLARYFENKKKEKAEREMREAERSAEEYTRKRGGLLIRETRMESLNK